MDHRTDSQKVQSLSAVALSLAAAAAIALAPAAAYAQTPPPADPNAAPPAALPPAGGYAPPPAGGYAPPPAGGYAPPPTGYYGPLPGVYAAPGPPGPGPRVISDFDEGQPIPAGYHKATRIRTGLIVGGAVTFGAVYLITATAGAIASDANDGGHPALLLIPVIGPFTLLGNNYGATADFFLVLDALAQAGGVAMFAAGFALPRAVLVRNDLSKVTIMPKPMTFGTNSAGFGVVGSF